MTKQERIEELEAQLKNANEQVENLEPLKEQALDRQKQVELLKITLQFSQHELDLTQRAYAALQDRVAGMLGL